MGSQMYLVKPVGKTACLRQAGSLARAAKRAAKEFPAGVETVRLVQAGELTDMAASGTPLPPAARRIVKAHRKPTPASEQRRVQKERLRQRVQADKPKQADKPQPPGQGAEGPFQLDLFHGNG
jgi:hypothetical protein